MLGAGQRATQEATRRSPLCIVLALVRVGEAGIPSLNKSINNACVFLSRSCVSGSTTRLGFRRSQVLSLLPHPGEAKLISTKSCSRRCVTAGDTARTCQLALKKISLVGATVQREGTPQEAAGPHLWNPQAEGANDLAGSRGLEWKLARRHGNGHLRRPADGSS